jgi:alpha-L-fucosidase
MSDVLATIPRGDYPAYADAQVRELVARYRPSVLWNDVAWPSPAADLWSLFTDYYAAVPDGVVNDRWLPWSPLLASTSWGPVRRLVDAGSRRAAAKAGGLVPPPPRHFDVRTPEYTRLPAGDRSAWECVRGMDRSFGHNASSRPEDFVSRRDLLWLLTDVVAAGGNLLLNVGPRGVDAQIPDEQRARLAWLRDWMAVNAGAVRSTRPWVTEGTATAERASVRYTTRDDTVFAFVQDAPASVTLPDVAPTPTTAVTTVAGSPLVWRATPGGLRVDVGDELPPGDPFVVACHDVVAAPRT